MNFSTRQQLEALERAIRHIPIAEWGMRAEVMEFHVQVLRSLADRLRRAAEREESRKRASAECVTDEL